MMDVTGPVQTANIQQLDGSALALRLNQRIVAEVLQVTEDRVALALEGVRFVAQLTSAEQAAQLVERRFAQFVVRDFSSQTITLQLVNPEQSPSQPASTVLPDLIPNLLKHAGLPVDESTIAIAQALLDRGLPVTPELLEELQNVLSQVEGWEQDDAQIAASLKAAGLPLTEGTLALARSNIPSMLELMLGLQSQLESFERSGESPRLAEQVANALSLLNQLVIDWSDSGSNIAEKLRQAVRIFGRSLENDLAKLLQDKSQTLEASSMGPNLLALAYLRRELAQDGLHQSLLDQIDRFLEGMRLMQFLNSETESRPEKGQWLRLDLPLGAFASQAQLQQGDWPELNTARLRVAYRQDGERPEIDPDHTQIVIRIEFNAKQVMQVELSVVDRRIGAQVTASTSELVALAESQLPSLQTGIEKLGYVLQTARVEVGSLVPNLDFDYPSLWKTFSEVRVEV